MSRILVLYGTTEGQTARIAQHMADVACDEGHSVELLNAQDLKHAPVIEDFDGVLIGASVHTGKHDGHVRNFVKANLPALERVPSGFFSVSLTAVSPEGRHQADLERLLAQFSQDTGWHPDKIGTFAGALLYTQYGFIKRMIMRMIVKSAGGDTDTSRDYEYTDWDGVTQFTRTFLETLPQKSERE